MKKIIIAFCLLAVNLYAQENYKKMSKEQLIAALGKKDAQIKQKEDSLADYKQKLTKITDEQKEAKKKKGKEKDLEIATLKEIITQNNELVFIREYFTDTYKDKNYFINTDLTANADLKKIARLNAIVNSIMAVSQDKDTTALCKKALAFNENFTALEKARKLLDDKYDKSKIDKALEEIKKLPKLEEEDSKLQNTKTHITQLLEQYGQKTCELKNTLEGIKGSNNTDATKRIYKEQETAYKDYPYLISKIAVMKKNQDTYKSDPIVADCK